MDHVAIVAWQLVGCALIGDFITGLVHWFEDTYGTLSMPLIGKLVIEPNILHHRSPSVMVTMGTIISRNLHPIVITSAVVGLFWSISYTLGRSLPWQIYSIAIFTIIGNECHAWSHGAGQIWPIRLLQEMGIVQSPKHHLQHHKAPYDRRFCTLTNILNPVLDGLKFWRGLEWLIGCLGPKIKRCTKERDYL